MAVIVGRAGSPVGQVVRVAAVSVLTLLALRVLRRGRHGLATAAALATGSTGIVAGCAIGVMHTAKGAVSISAIAGLAALAAGLVLTALGVVALWRATPGWWRLLFIPGAVVAFEVLLPLIGGVYATNVPPTSLGSETPTDFGFEYEDIVLTTDDGVQLSAWYIPSRDGAAVIALHGAGSTRSNVLPHAAVLAEHGYGVLLLDTRGHGRSEGRAMDFGWYGNTDIDAALDHVVARPDVDPQRVGLLGLSMGGEQAITAAATDARVRAVVAEGVTRRTFADSTTLPHDFPGWVERGMDWIQYQTADLLSDATPPIALRTAFASGVPTLLVAGNPRHEIDLGRTYRDVPGARVELWELPDTGHTDALANHGDAWEANVTAFLDEHLG